MTIIYDKESIEKIRIAGKILSNILDDIEDYLTEGIDTKTLDNIIFDKIIKNKCKPSLVGYKGYPFCSCISVNEVVCHGIPNKNNILKNGDIIKIDSTICYEGYHCDSARTFLVGKKEDFPEKFNLIKTSYELMNECIKQAKPNKSLMNIAKTTNLFLSNKKYQVFKDFCGHGIGKNVHEEPKILFFENKSLSYMFFIPGMIITIEPIIYEGNSEYIIDRDGWSIIKKDRKNSSHFEHSVLITDNGNEILTYSEKLEKYFICNS